MSLKNHFITTDRPYAEGVVEVFEQRIQSGAVQKATLTITALGVYEAEINGRKVGNILFAPGFTYYPLDLQYQTYDITSNLTGQDVLRVYLAQGWYCGRFTYRNKVKIYGDKPAVSWILSVEKTDGSREIFCSDDESVTAVKSPYEYAGFYDGEVYCANGSGWEVYPPVRFLGEVPAVIEEGSMCVRIREEMPIREVIVRGEVTILDFGQNFAGFLTIDPSKMQGDSLKLRHGEILKADGSLYTANLRKAKAEILYTRGETREKYVPKFTYMGFRYVELSGVPYIEGLVTAYAIYSDMERTGYFSCENTLAQKLFENQVWGQKSNYIEVPTDCPQRDERMGYTGDGHVFARTGAYNFDTEQFWSKFLKDIRFSQQDNEEGYVTPTVPAEPKEQRGFVNMLGWGNCVCIVPELLYWMYGTDQYIREQYESMKRFVELEISKMGRWHKDLWIGISLGDWLTMNRSPIYMILHNNPVSNAFVINDLRIMAWAAGLLGMEEDKVRYQNQYERSRKAYIKTFVRKNGRVRDDYQGAYIMALQMVLPKGELWSRVFQRLTEKIQKEGMDTGFFGTEHLLPLLASNGRKDLAFDLLLSDRCPGWMYQVKAGATTSWERWDSLKPDGTVNEVDTNGDNMVSFNHYSFGSVGRFYYEYILGIQPLKPGFAEARIKPYVDSRIGAYSGQFNSRYGTFEVSYCKGELHIKTPVKSQIDLGERGSFEVAPGEYFFTKEMV